MKAQRKAAKNTNNAKPPASSIPSNMPKQPRLTRQDKLDFVYSSNNLRNSFQRFVNEAKNREHEILKSTGSEKNIHEVCWTWTRTKKGEGYGVFHFRMNGKRLYLYAHQLSLFISHQQPQSPQSIVCHKCDNPSCINPSHLYLGSPASNANDLRTKNLRSHMKPYYKKFNEDTILKIRNDYNQGGITQAALAKKYNTTQPTISALVRGERYVAVQGPLTTKYKQYVRAEKYCKLKKADREQILHMYFFQKKTLTEITKHFNVSMTSVRSVIRNPQRILLEPNSKTNNSQTHQPETKHDKGEI